MHTETPPHDYQALATRLEAKNVEEVREIYDGLILAMGDVPLKQELDERRLIHLFDCSATERGKLLCTILGEQAAEISDFLPNPETKRYFENTTVHFKSKKGIKDPCFYRVYPGLQDESLSIDEAQQQIKHKDVDQEGQLLIKWDFNKIDEEWMLTAHREQNPDELKKLITTSNVKRSALEIFHFPSKPSAENLFSGQAPGYAMGTKLISVAISSDEEISDLKGIDCIPAEQITKTLKVLFRQSAVLLKPEKRRLISTILLLYRSAHHSLSKQKADSRLQTNLENALYKAELKWERMLIQQRQLSLIQLNSEVAAHAFLKTKMIFKGAREAQIGKYLHDILIPLANNFAKTEAHNMREISLNFDHPISLDQDFTLKQRKADFLAGLIMATPSLALLIPAVSQMDEGISTFLDDNTLPLAEIEWPDLDLGMIKKFIFEDAIKTYKAGVKHASDILGDGMENINDTLGKLTGLVVMASVGAAILGIVGTIIAIKGSLSLHHAQHLLNDRIDDLQNQWPKIRKAILESLPALDNQCSAEVQEKAKKVVETINQI